MKTEFGNVALSAWKGISVSSQIDESECDVEKLVILNDHGDDFLIVKTKDGKVYKYGYFMNLKFKPCSYIREPKLFRKEDERSYVNNRIFFYIRGDHGENFVDRMTCQINKDSKDVANYKLKCLASKMQSAYNSGVMYHFNDDKEIIKRYLIENNIDTEENIRLLNNIIFDTSYYGIDGIAGKIDLGDCKWIYGDKIKYAYSNGKCIRLKRKTVGYDEWGVCTYAWKL